MTTTAGSAAGAEAVASRLRAQLDGRAIVPGDVAYDEVRQVYVGGSERRPALIARPRDAAEVALVVTAACDAGVELAVRAGGHSIARHGLIDGGVVLDLRELRGLDIDVERRSAWAQAGLTAGEYGEAVGAHGLATGFGDTATVGIAGLTLGGGIGYLARKHGLTVDSLLAAEVVTADGQVLTVDDDHHPDLFWALRGGGGNFGVVTRLHLRLHEVGTVLGGMLLLPAEPAVLESLIAEAQAAPDELTTIIDVLRLPPLPIVPDEHHGVLGLLVRLCYAGPLDDGERVVAPLRALATPLLDLVQPMPYAALLDDEDHGRPLVAIRASFVDGVDRDRAEAIIDHAAASTALMGDVELRVLGGAVSRVPSEATAYAHRDREVAASVMALYENPEEAAEHEGWARGLADELRDGSGAAYVNFLGEDGRERIRDAYPGATWDRLAAVKGRYDPDNVFRSNQNIPPA